ncbi:trinucleotide repeat-containing gene 6C protein-like isoform X2 [Watersipora subatra]|uniref:trinucleotide repeat-containing gene 6C protein-like isoform X2 n=1 Tax=Watersipora subatra TaxID=2589382 RepID=UPI00355C6E07
MATSTMSQPSVLPQALVPGASQSHNSSETSSNSVINPSSSAPTGAAGNETQWLDSSSSDWDKQPSNSQPNTPRLDHSTNPVTTSQFTGWGTQSLSSTFSDTTNASSNKWSTAPTSNNNNSNMPSPWGSQSPNQRVPQSSHTSDWGMPTGSSSTTQWGMPSTPVTQAEQDSWGQPKLLPNAGTDGWGQTASASSGQPITPSSAPSAQPSQWGPSTSHSSSPATAWQSTPSNPSTVSNPPDAVNDTSASTAQQSQWGATTSAGASNTVSPPTTTSSTQETGAASAAPTSWAGAAAKGLPKSLPKPQEPVDPAKVALELTINNPEGWGRVPVRQDTSWGKTPEKTHQDESNQWHSTQNNGTAIWETAKTNNGGPTPTDKSTWNQKVAGNNDPNVWNGEGSKDKDNALWDNLPSTKEPDTPGETTNSWNSQAPQSRTISVSSGGAEGSESAWPSNPGAVSRSSPPNSISQQPTGLTGPDPGWSSQNGSNPDPRKLHRWDSSSGQPAIRMHSVSNESPDCDAGVSANSPVVELGLQQSRLMHPHSQPLPSAAVGAPLPSAQPSAAAGLTTQLGGNGRGYWDQSQGRPSGPPSNWNNKSSASWSGENSSVTGTNWGQSQSSAGNNSGWGDTPSNSWQSGAGAGRKPSFNYEDGQANGDLRERRPMGEGDDADMGDWNESNSVWSSAAGFKQPRKHSSIPEGHMAQHAPSSRMGGHFGNSTPSMMNSHSTGMGTKQQMLHYLVTQLKFPKDEAHSALINNNMNMEAAIAELKASMHMGGRSEFGAMAAGPIVDNAFNPNIPPPNIATNTLNTPFTNNAQHNSTALQGSSRINKPNQPRVPIGRGGSTTQTSQQQGAIIKQQLEMGVQMNNIHPHLLHLPLVEHNLRTIRQLISLQQSYQQQHDTLIQRRHGQNSPQVESISRSLASINAQMKTLQQPLIHNIQSQMNAPKYGGGITDGMGNLSLTSNPSQTGPQASSSQSRLGIWTDKAPGSRQGANHVLSSSSLHASHSTPNLQGGVLGENSPWASSSSSSMWSNNTNSGPYLDNQNESRLAAANNGPQSFDIPEFVPGVPWQGANTNKVEDDPNITPGSVATSLSVSTASLLNGSGRSSTDLGWSNNSVTGNKSTWSSQNPSPANDMWNKTARPPPGFNRNINRSVSMPQGPSDKISAFSPVGIAASWDSQSGLSSASNPWLILRNLPHQVDGNTLKTLCQQHGPLQHFFVSSNSGQALVRYTAKEEALKAQKSLNSCPMYEATITAEFIDENEVQRIIDQCQRQGSVGRSHSVSAAPGSGVWPNTNNNSSSSNLWGSTGSVMHSAVGGSASTWGGVASGFLPASDIGGNSYAM